MMRPLATIARDVAIWSAVVGVGWGVIWECLG
jgi:hypothetical protein